MGTVESVMFWWRVWDVSVDFSAVPTAQYSLAPYLPVHHQDLIVCFLMWLRRQGIHGFLQMLLVLMVLQCPLLNTQSASPLATFGDAMAWYVLKTGIQLDHKTLT